MRSMPDKLDAIDGARERRHVDSLHGPGRSLRLGLFLSNFVFNVFVMLKPFAGEPVALGDYFTKGNCASAPGGHYRRCDLGRGDVVCHHRR